MRRGEEDQNKYKYEHKYEHGEEPLLPYAIIP